MDKITKLFVESYKPYSKLLARKYPDLTPEEADKKVCENIDQSIPLCKECNSPMTVVRGGHLVSHVCNNGHAWHGDERRPQYDEKPIQKPVLAETPIDQFQTIGDFNKGSSFAGKSGKIDRAILTNPKSVQKIKDKFANTSQNFDMYFVNTKEARNHKEVGEVSEDFIRNQLKLDTPINKSNISIFYTGNAADEKEMMTAWIIAHRFGHVVKNLPGWGKLCREVNEMIQRIMRDAYNRKMLISQDGVRLGSESGAVTPINEKILNNFYQEIGTFKSARDKNIRNSSEFMYELISQYLTTGKIAFNGLPKYIPVRYAWGKPVEGVRFTEPEGDLDYYNGYLESLAEIYPDYAENLLRECVGKIFVM